MKDVKKTMDDGGKRDAHDADKDKTGSQRVKSGKDFGRGCCEIKDGSHGADHHGGIVERVRPRESGDKMKSDTSHNQPQQSKRERQRKITQDATAELDDTGERFELVFEFEVRHVESTLPGGRRVPPDRSRGLSLSSRYYNRNDASLTNLLGISLVKHSILFRVA